MSVRYEPVIGLEVHAQLLSKSKLFSPASNAFGGTPNTQISPVCLALPGALPVPNRGAVEMAVSAALALGCQVRLKSRFDRKHYFYPDLPKGYQISQYEFPFAEDGEVKLEVEGKARRIRIQRIHMEEDAAKNIHGSSTAKETLVDFNRAGVPLVEIVTHPDLQSALEAELYLRRLREVLLFVGVNDGNLEEGSFRCDANVSIRPVGQSELGTRVELKNINSFRFVRKAIEHEITRQEAILGNGGKVSMETRMWSERQGKTLSMRGKEQAHDYRYFPDPDLPPLVIPEAMIRALRDSLPELPEAKRMRWQRDYGLTSADAHVLTGHPRVAEFFEQTVSLMPKMTKNIQPDSSARLGKRVANFMQAELLRHTKTMGLSASFPVEPTAVVELLDLVDRGTISGKMAKDVFGAMLKTGRSASQVVEEQGLVQVTDSAAIEAEIRKVFEAHPEKVAQYNAGKTTLLGFFVGQVMRATKGASNPQLLNQTLKTMLESRKP
ncbi:MAG: Asp-tRNA(Asn)/Glu-tRNA(Gln) amidotransferase subunit GatB [Myxococcales bacterium]|nr:Asp-tRNA(Asn)/Glu-tRNA(Gln) amidotransferase subunit GatB [Myxococcales bacterium]MCB9709535.1 Asp-tRNA(Asn)/Glu-tRNA(Gln) amidotransferase subunit GatB [Myxococcales bacterium]